MGLLLVMTRGQRQLPAATAVRPMTNPRSDLHLSHERQFRMTATVKEPPQLTTQQRRVFDAVSTYIDLNGYPPSIREIGAAVGFASVSAVVNQLNNLVAAGYLRRDPSRSRAISIIKRPEGSQE